MELMNAIIQASCHALALSLTMPHAETHDAYRDGRERKWVADDAPEAKFRTACMAAAVAVFHFLQRWGAQGTVRGHMVSRVGCGLRGVLGVVM